MTDSSLRIENLSFRYRSRADLALRSISFEAAAGQVLLIAGASGCGKTTLIRCINGLIPNSYKGEIQGGIWVQGKPIQGLSLARISQMVGTVLQDPERQILGTRVINEVAFGLENLHLSREEILSRVDEALTRLNILHLKDRETFHLSGGEKQKVAIAGVLAMRPLVLLLDEPLASLDPASAQETLQMVRRLADDGMTVLMVEHRVEDVLNIHPETAMFLDEGEIRYYGPTAGLYRAVDYHRIKLPAPLILERAVKDPVPEPVTRQLEAAKAGIPNQTLVRFEGVRFGYEENQTVLAGINLEIRRGDIIAVLGPNGAGKTTLVKHAIGLLKPKAGRVLVDGRDTHQISVAEVAHTLGYVFQSPSHMLFAETVRAELAFGPTNLKHPPEEIEKDVREAIRIVHLEGFEENPPLALSFGQQKRVSIAAILAMRSRILVMDEPTAGQDYKNYMEFMDAILKLPGFEAVLFITHDIDLAVIYANRVILVNHGQVVRDGTPEEVLKDLAYLEENRLVPTSLLKTNLELYAHTRSFQRAEDLAHLGVLQNRSDRYQNSTLQ
ncbi:MAG TPA: ABC transporter ATP-binding protein [Anaerolineaceae bacterium]|nr:ABC transporter ATP-binding protein [Longilinea sp.]HOD43336.1 ABC transporter ATP-binding protein [Anaerolineaceae bacterium]HOU42914.1 ABC transporter ATP-binding protein [Anaerolineaceae bacterium]HQF44407.1 ABC transporter ATP-binding protein [Anaerolineaceae bacterium]HQH34294.1 ABC transporter ATP-binding protein [Anaerolineaceae bacterium]